MGALRRKSSEDDKAFFAPELGPGFFVEDAFRHTGEEVVYLAVRYASGEREGKTVGMAARTASLRAGSAA